MTASTLGHATSTATLPTQRRRRPRPRPPLMPPWTCENCTQDNPGRRRRCMDCGTSHY